VIAGVIGSRLYHVATDWSKFSPDHYSDIPKIWQGGLGIPGGLIGGIGVGAYLIKRRGMPLGIALNCAAPALALAQAIGRWGNYFNQELYGGPTKLPWGLEIDFDHRTGPAAKYAADSYKDTVFHPTFLYESLSNFALAGILLWIDRKYKVRPGRLLAIYVLGYGAIRFFVEGMRIDEAHHVGGLRWNQWVALAAVIAAGAYLLAMRGRGESPAAAAVATRVDEDDETDDEADDEFDSEDDDADDTWPDTDDTEVEPDEEAGDEGIDEPDPPTDPAVVSEDELPSEP
jgi:prolipoprotein diacylglyceryl transferase